MWVWCALLLFAHDAMSAFGSGGYTAGVVLGSCIGALHSLLLSAQQHSQANLSPPPDLSPTIAFVSLRVLPISHSFYLCQIIETLFLVPAVPKALSSSLALCAVAESCVSQFRALYELSLDSSVVELIQLVCAYVWRVACVVMETREGGKREWLVNHFRKERKRRRDEEMKAEGAIERKEP